MTVLCNVNIEFLYLPVVIYLTVHRNLVHVCTHSVNITPSNEEKNTVPGMFDIDTDNLHIEREKEREDIDRL